MFDIELKSGKRKRKSPGLQQPLPVPIASLTGIKANDAIWRFYHGKWNQELNMVVIENPQEIEFVKNMGSFGTIFRYWREKRKRLLQKQTKKDEGDVHTLHIRSHPKPEEWLLGNSPHYAGHHCSWCFTPTGDNLVLVFQV